MIVTAMVCSYLADSFFLTHTLIKEKLNIYHSLNLLFLKKKKTQNKTQQCYARGPGGAKL